MFSPITYITESYRDNTKGIKLYNIGYFLTAACLNDTIHNIIYLEYLHLELPTSVVQKHHDLNL